MYLKIQGIFYCSDLLLPFRIEVANIYPSLHILLKMFRTRELRSIRLFTFLRRYQKEYTSIPSNRFDVSPEPKNTCSVS